VINPTEDQGVRNSSRTERELSTIIGRLLSHNVTIHNTMSKEKAQLIINWWINKYYWKDPPEEEPIWFEVIGDKLTLTDVVSYTYAELLTIANKEL